MENIKRIKICGYIFDRIKSICNKGSDKIPNDKRHEVKNNDFEAGKAIMQAHEAFA